ncbi:Modifier of mdg4 [Eumeta japonica]|uniref:Modifier of mdg4 n=1 Tax=Eumeta variegata TaxID=151549 RepID=A0A4C2A2J6_EUMVA|nr:Modifier of mdg4 [Eumeta japonica]
MSEQNGELVDMTVAADGHLVRVHRLLLASNLSYNTLCSLLEYIYTGEVHVSIENIKDVLNAGKALRIKGFEDMVQADRVCERAEGLSLIIDKGLTFKTHITVICRRAASIYKQLACAAKVTWRLNRGIISTIYVTVIEPIVLYAASA